MKVEHVSANLFTIDLEPHQLEHLLYIAQKDKEKMLDVLRLWCEIGFYTSTSITYNLEEKCRSRNSQNPNFS